MDRKDKVEGEGSYSGTKDYNQRTKKFIDSGKVEEAADDASRPVAISSSTRAMMSARRM